MCFGGDTKNKNDPLWWGYIDDGKTARPKSEFIMTPAYNKHLRQKGNKTYKPVDRAAVPASVRAKR